VQSKKSSTSKRVHSDDETPKPIAPSKRIFGSAKGQITFKKGWDAPMTKRELDEFLGH
jgi:hypothetical protein